MNAKQREAWVQKQIGVLIDLGDDFADAEETTLQALRAMPDDVADPDRWVESVYQSADDAGITAADIASARAAWYASDDIPPQYKRILDAEETEEGPGA